MLLVIFTYLLNDSVFNIGEDGFQGMACCGSQEAGGHILVDRPGIAAFLPVLEISDGDFPIPTPDADAGPFFDRPEEEESEIAHGQNVVIDQVQHIHDQRSDGDKLKNHVFLPPAESPAIRRERVHPRFDPVSG